MANNEPQENETLIEFPCDFPIKVMGDATSSFASEITTVIQETLPSFDKSGITSTASSNGKYISLTCTVHVTSKPQLDNIYRTVNAHPKVKYLL